jgi:hypothetical protein
VGVKRRWKDVAICGWTNESEDKRQRKGLETHNDSTRSLHPTFQTRPSLSPRIPFSACVETSVSSVSLNASCPSFLWWRVVSENCSAISQDHSLRRKRMLMTTVSQEIWWLTWWLFNLLGRYELSPVSTHLAPRHRPGFDSHLLHNISKRVTFSK